MAREASFALLERVLPVRRAGAIRVEYAEWFVKAPEEAAVEPSAASLVPAGSIAALPPFPARIAGLAPSAGARSPLALEGAGGGSLLVIDRRGKGLSAAVLGFPLWRWRLAGNEGARAYESLLGGIVQYLAEGAKSPPIALDADRALYRSGDRIRFTASIGEREAPEGLRGELRRPSGDSPVVEATFLFEPDPRRPGIFRAALDGLAPGDYSAVAVESPPGALGASRPVEFSVEPLSVEFLDTSPDRALLARTAAETKGACVERSALDSAAAVWNLPGKSVEIRSARDLRGSAFGFLGLVALLGAEWIVRKAWGLV